jgi:hypothetical protein
MPRTVLLPVLILLLSPLAVGCGGDDKEDASAPQAEPLSKTEFLAQADEICANGNAEISAAAEEITGEPSDEEIAMFAEEVLVPNTQKQHDEIAKLGAPEGDEETVREMLDALQEGIDVVADDPSTLLSKDDPLAEASDLAEAYGLVECAG